MGGGEQLQLVDRQVPGRSSRAAAGHRGVEVRADVDAELGGDRGGCRLARRAGDDSGRAVAVGYLPRRPQQRIGYAGCVVELVKGWWR